MKKFVKEPIECGVFVDIHHKTQFNWNKDVENRELIWLKRDSYGYITKEDVIVIYGYSYADSNYPKDKLREFRDFIKHPNYNTDDVEKFVSRGIENFCRVSDIDNYDIIVGVPSKQKPSILDEIKVQLMDMCNSYMSFGLIKEMYKNVTFDSNKAKSILKSCHYNGDIDDTVEFVAAKFNDLKKTNQLFAMKRFMPRQIRDAFSGFLKFGSEDEKIAYENLQGVNVLMYDDLCTSGATLKEMARYLRSINPTNTLTAFVLIKQ